MQGAIFDMDGTLMDSMEAWATAGERYLRARGLTPCGGKADSLVYQGMLGAARHFQHTYGITDDVDLITRDVYEQVWIYYDTKAVPIEGVIPFLQQLKENGVRMCVATATDRRLAEPLLDKWGLLAFFDKVFTCKELATDKTVSRIYDAATAFMGTDKAQTWVFEDAAYAVRTAKVAGYPVCAIADRFEERAALVRQTADRYITDYREAMDLVQWG